MIDFIVALTGRMTRFVSGRSDELPGIIPKTFLMGYLHANPVIVEAGAHIGLDTEEMSRLWPKGVIHAFEPVPELYEKLEQRTGHLRNVVRYPLAVADRSGRSKMFVSSGASDGSSSLLTPKEHLDEHPDVRFDQAIEVRTITLDDWARQQGINHVDLLWLDMQGAELAAMMAAPHVLRTVKAIHLEVSLKEVYEGGPLYPEVRRWLEAQGFRVEREALPWPDMGNVLFTRSGG